MKEFQPLQEDAIAGAILGCAVGDALGLLYEGLSKRRGKRIYGEPDRFRLLFVRGMVSDDTEHTLMVARALCEFPDDPDKFARRLGGYFRWWLLGIPAGIGLATLKAILRLWCGVPASRSGVYSAGNGAAMRSAILGAASEDSHILNQYVRVSTQITHTDVQAYFGAFIVAMAAWSAKRGKDTPDAFFEAFHKTQENSGFPEFYGLIGQVEQSLKAGETTEAFADKICGERGVSGYILHTVPVCLHAWLSFPRDYRKAVQAVIRCGGDTDTTAAIVGAIVGAGVGREGIPLEWRTGLWEPVHSVDYMERLAEATQNAVQHKPFVLPKTKPLIGIIRNLLFLFAILFHGFRRLFPPASTLQFGSRVSNTPPQPSISRLR